MWVQLREDERYRLVYQRVDIHRIHILVADDVQQVDRQALDQVADGDDEVIGPAGRDDRVDDLVHIGGLVRLVARLVEQFLDDV